MCFCWLGVGRQTRIWNANCLCSSTTTLFCTSVFGGKYHKRSSTTNSNVSQSPTLRNPMLDNRPPLQNSDRRSRQPSWASYRRSSRKCPTMLQQWIRYEERNWWSWKRPKRKERLPRSRKHWRRLMGLTERSSSESFDELRLKVERVRFRVDWLRVKLLR